MTSLNSDSNDITRSDLHFAKDTIIGHYRIIEKIGAGGMGEVYLAEDSELNRKVALKFLPSHLCQDADCRARFKREAQAAAKLDHPNIVTVHEVGEYHSRPFISMQHIEGQSLKEVLSSRTLPLDRIMDIVIQVCDGLQAAHDSGITHRDIKPSNILIDSHGRTRIVDFGLATIQGSETLTKTGSTLGTIGYMSPEQVRGEKTEARSDLFSLGIVLYEMITARRPFSGDYEAAVIYSILNEHPKPMAEYRNDVPPELQRIVDRSLNKIPDARFDSAADMKIALTNTRNSDVTAIIPTARRRKFSKTRIIFPAVALAFLAVISIIIYSRAALHRWLPFEGESTSWEKMGIFAAESKPFVMVIAPFWGASTEAEAEGHVMQSLIEREIVKELGSEEDFQILSKDIKEAPRTYDEAKALGKKCDATVVIWGEVLLLREEVEIQPYLTYVQSQAPSGQNPTPALEANVLTPNQLELRKSKAKEVGNIALLVAARYYFGKGELEKSLALVQQIDQPSAQTLSFQGNIEQAKGRPAQAEELYKIALSQDSSNALTYSFLAVSLMLQSKYDSAIEMYQKALTVGPKNERILVSIANQYRYAGKTEMAISFLKDAIERSPASSHLHAALGWIYVDQGRKDDAITEYRTAIRLDAKNGDAFYGLGWLYEFGFDDSLDQAVVNYKNAIRVGTSQFTAFSPHLTLGRVYYKQGKYEKAISEHLRVLTLSPWEASAYHFLRISYVKLGREKEAIALFEKAISLNPENVELRAEFCGLYYDLGESSAALSGLMEVIRLAPGNGDNYLELGSIYEDLDSLKQAVSSYQSALSLGVRNRPIFIVQYNLARVYNLLEMYREAIAASKQVMSLNPSYGSYARWILGSVYTGQARYDDAVGEYEKAIDADSSNIYGRLLYYFALLRAGKTSAAVRYIADLSSQCHDSLWVSDLVRFCGGQMDADALLKEAARDNTMPNSTQKTCEAYYYLGMSYLVDPTKWKVSGIPDTASARLYFEKCQAVNAKNIIEGGYAKVELRRLQTDKP